MEHALHIYDTMQKKKVAFEPIDSSNVRLYVCGPTIYDLAHIGNARPVVVFDTLVRFLRYQYPKVTYVRNITDVDDKINARASENNESIGSLTERYTKFFHDDMKELNAIPPDVEPRATDHIDEMIDMISILLEKKYAYVSDRHVLFDTTTIPEHGKLSGRTIEELKAGARVEVASYKKNPQDFVLWKPSTLDLPGWGSPWGRGRPGWHIECSAMSMKYLGENFDIHGGGQDLIFPHHENEIAQSTCANDHSNFAKYWIHNGHVMSEGKKMAKSEGNFYSVRELLEKFPGEVIRFTLLQTHYHQPLDFTMESLQRNKEILDKFYIAIRDIEFVKNMEKIKVQPSEVVSALQDDLNTPLAITRLHEMLHTLNKKTNDFSKMVAKKRLVVNANMLGLLEKTPEEWLQGSDKTDINIDIMVKERDNARISGDYEEADRIRSLLLDDGIILEDSGNETTWRYK